MSLFDWMFEGAVELPTRIGAAIAGVPGLKMCL